MDKRRIVDMKKQIKFMVMDVDGTLTDGKIYMGINGEIFKAFDVRDGYGIKRILKENRICPVIITGRKSPIVEMRGRELGITDIYQGIENKLCKLQEILGTYSKKEEREYSFQDVAYIGDDIADLQCLKAIREAGGIAGCPADAVCVVKEVSQYVCSRVGGAGAVRELIDWVCGTAL